jgi:transposase
MGYMRKSRLSNYKQERLIEHFVAGTAARCAASLAGVNRKTAACYYLRLREIIAFKLEQECHEEFGGITPAMKQEQVASLKLSTPKPN